jgi:acyl carrier protein
MTAVETALRKHPDVIDVASRVIDGPPARRVVAVAAQVHCAPIDLRDHVWDTVSEPDLPDVLVVLPRLPRADDGSPQLNWDAVATGEGCSFVQLETPTERAIGEIWSEVLGRTRISAEDDFLSLGGDSMTATLLLDLTNDRLGTALTFDELLSVRNLRELARSVDARRES